PVDVSKTLSYKGMMLAGVPNFSLTIGYTNASWTLKADLVASYVVRLLKYMKRHGYQTVTPDAPAEVAAGHLVPLIDLQAGYVLRSVDALPKQGERSPWRLHQNYLRDFRLFRAGRLTDDVRFGRSGGGSATRVEQPLDLPGTSFLTVDGVRLRHRDTGAGDPVLLLHGIGQSLEDWTEQHDRLSARHRVLSLDLPGFAYSGRVPGTATLERLASILPAYLDAVGVAGSLPVIGNSLGGAVAMTFAAAHPDCVSALVLADSAGFGSEVTLVLRLLAIRPLGAVLMRPDPRNSERTVQAVFYDRALATDARIRHSHLLSQRRNHSRTMLEVARDLGTFRGVRPEWRESLLARIRNLDVPTLLLWGDHDHILPFSHLAAAGLALPSAESHVFERIGHMPQIERPDEFASVVEEFLQGPTRRRPAGASAPSPLGARRAR
ncbi:MAG: monooxygenase, partial [Subtercola sp.]|nr:monooxygenase [Subtercola sp.]